MSATPQDNSPKRQSWLTILGNIEALVSAGVLFRVFTATTRPGSPLREDIEMFVTIGIGAGLALGGVRFGNEFGRKLGWFTAVIYALLVTALVVTSLIPRDRLVRFWSSVFPVL